MRSISPWRTASGCAVVGVLLLAAPSWAGRAFVPCTRPFVFTGSNVNVVVFPYTTPPGGPALELSEAGQQVSLLIQESVLMDIARYGSIGAVHLVLNERADEPCTQEEVMQKLLGAAPGAETTLKPGRGLVLVWGSIFEQNGEILLQTFARFLRRDRREDLAFRFGNQTLFGLPSAQTITFSPQVLTVKDIEDIGRSFQETLILRDSPSPDSPGRPLYGAQNLVTTSGYWIEDRQGEWLKIRLQQGDLSGWVRAGSEVGALSLADKLPELHYITLLVGYLRDRQGQDGMTRPPAATLDWCRESLARYQGLSEPGKAPLPIAVGEQLIGMMEFQHATTVQEKASALRLFESAARRVPYSAGARSLETLARLQLDDGGPQMVIRSTEVEGKLMQAAALEPRNPAVVANLQSFYEYLERVPARQSPGFEIEPAQLKLKIEALKQATRERPGGR